MLKVFDKSLRLDCDCFVADYSELTNNERKVVISTVPFDDIAFFHLHKSSKAAKMPYLAVNLEQYPQFIKGIQNCECVFKSLTPDKNAWVMLLELKYCKEDKTELYSHKAFMQMHETLLKLEKLGCADRKVNNVYLVYSSPENFERQPFGAWTISQNDTLKEIESTGVHLLGYCKILIGTPHYLFPPKIRE